MLENHGADDAGQKEPGDPAIAPATWLRFVDDELWRAPRGVRRRLRVRRRHGVGEALVVQDALFKRAAERRQGDRASALRVEREIGRVRLRVGSSAPRDAVAGALGMRERRWQKVGLVVARGADKGTAVELYGGEHPRPDPP